MTRLLYPLAAAAIVAITVSLGIFSTDRGLKIPNAVRAEGRTPSLEAPTSPTPILRGAPVLSAAERSRQEAIEADAQRQHDLLAEEGDRRHTESPREEEPVPAPLPVALLEPKPALTAAPNERQIILEIRAGFLKAMQVAGDPNSASYAEKWMAEQVRADELLQAYLGVEKMDLFDQAGRFAP